ncbi:MAG: peptidase T [Clostridioides sp.]|nr:peptidase T [Clostridioides sp.]
MENVIREKMLERFLKYVSFHTTSNSADEHCPSTSGQMEFAKYLVEELKSLGLEDASVDENAYVMATLKGNAEGVDTIGFISHMDTSEDVSGENVKPRIIKNYDGKDIVLNEGKNIVTKVNDYPELVEFKGQDIIVTDGTTLLGADDKAGIAEIMTAIEYLAENKDIKRGDIKVGFTPDEEIGRGADLFDVEKFGAKYAYTLDGGICGELESENFNAASATVTIHGINVHPGSAKNKLVNSLYIAGEMMQMFPANERPETTEGYEGFYHANAINGNVDTLVVSYIIRDHDRKIFEERKEFFAKTIEKLNEKYNNIIDCEIKDQYYNMKEKVDPVKFVVDIAEEAMKDAGVVPKIVPIRGGTDGARLSFMGLPCPNLFVGGLNFHSRNECVSIDGMEKAVQVVINIVKKYADR